MENNVSLSQKSWWGIGGLADSYLEINSIEVLRSTLLTLRKNEINSFIFGRGTNLLFDDAGYRGCIIHMGSGFSRVSIQGSRIIAEAGCWMPHLALVAARCGLSGIEHTIGIPASLGGLICMNGGSRRRSISEVVESVTVLSGDGTCRTDYLADCEFAYRSSRYQRSGDIVLGATLHFNEFRCYEEQRTEMLNILRERNQKFPRKLPSCGSVFKSSPELYEAYGPPGKIIEDLGFKGKTRGRVQVSPRHANFIVNLGGGSSTDVLSLVEEIQTTVFQKIGIRMMPEFLYVDPIDGPREVSWC